jgi:hypothetical protein
MQVSFYSCITCVYHIVYLFGVGRDSEVGVATPYQWRTQEFCFEGGYARNFFLGWGVQQIRLRTEGGENGDLGAIAP